MLTVADLVTDLDLNLLVGEANVEFPVRWVHMSELPDPTPWLSGGEVLLTTGMQLKSPDVQREFIERLVDRQLAALGFGVGFEFDEVPLALLRAAAERDFPVFEIPYELPFIAVSEAAFTKLVNEEYAILRRALAAQDRLKQIVLSERGIDDLVATLATLVGAAVVLLDARGDVLAEHAFRRRLEPGTIAALREEVRDRAGARAATSSSHPSMTRAGASPSRSSRMPHRGSVRALRRRPRPGSSRSRMPDRFRILIGYPPAGIDDLRARTAARADRA